MSNLKILKMEAAKHGATVEVGELSHHDHSKTIEVIAPDNMQWIDSGCAIMNGYVYTYIKDNSDVYSDLIQRMSYGLEPLTEE